MNQELQVGYLRDTSEVIKIEETVGVIAGWFEETAKELRQQKPIYPELALQVEVVAATGREWQKGIVILLKSMLECLAKCYVPTDQLKLDMERTRKHKDDLKRKGTQG